MSSEPELSIATALQTLFPVDYVAPGLTVYHLPGDPLDTVAVYSRKSRTPLRNLQGPIMQDVVAMQIVVSSKFADGAFGTAVKKLHNTTSSSGWYMELTGRHLEQTSESDNGEQTFSVVFAFNLYKYP